MNEKKFADIYFNMKMRNNGHVVPALYVYPGSLERKNAFYAESNLHLETRQ